MPEPDKNWKNIEPLLKWTAVAYAIGFVTVMIHTAKLGIPVLQLIEPVHIWIGAPVAAVVFFVDKILLLFKRALFRLTTQLRDAAQERDQMLQADEMKELVLRVGHLFSKALSLAFLGPLSLMASGLERLLFKMLEGRLVKEISLLSEHESLLKDQKAGFLRFTGKLLYWSRVSTLIHGFLSAIVMVSLIPIACVLYIWVVYPVIPQSFGGGKAIEVRLIINREKVPEDAEELRALTPGETHMSDAKEPKAATTVPVTLHYQTGKAYYIRKDAGPIIAIEHDAVDGVIFLESAPATSLRSKTISIVPIAPDPKKL